MRLFSPIWSLIYAFIFQFFFARERELGKTSRSWDEYSSLIGLIFDEVPDRQVVVWENNETRIEIVVFILGGCTKLLFSTKKSLKSKSQKIIA